jgi:osmotically inducible protein OsmC
MTEKSASVHWEGQGKKGQGQISTETAALKAYPYGFGSRFEDDRSGTNPEELLGAAHAACFTMAFSFACDKAGFSTEKVDTRARVRLVQQGDGFADRPHRADAGGAGSRHRRSEVPGNCRGRQEGLPAVKALASVPEITLTATLLK